MKTAKLYLEQPELAEFQAKVLKIENYHNNFAVILDKTAFYPTSGGQMHDTGTINGVSVIDVIEKEDQIWHIAEERIEGEFVTGKINWERRFDFMQQHTAFHILAQSFLRVTEMHTLSSHLGEKISTIDVDIKIISEEQLMQVELLANRICYENRSVRQFFVEEDELKRYKLRAMPAKGDNIRLVEIEEFDIDPCAGTHVKTTGQVGVIKILAQEKIRGYSRFYFLAGKRALQDYQKKSRILKELSNRFTEAEDKLLEKFIKLEDEKRELLKLKKKYQSIRISQIAEQIIQEISDSQENIFSRIFEDIDLNELREIAKQVSKRASGMQIFALKAQPGNLVITRSADIDIDIRKYAPKIAQLLNCRGGGRPDYIEFGGIDPALLSKNLPAVKKLLT